MSEKHLLEKIEDKVATITLNRPKFLNALTRDMLDDLYTLLSKYASNPLVGSIILTGEGSAFCSGGDVKAMASGRDDGVSLEQRARELRRRMEISTLLHEINKPTIAMIRGPAAGAGMSLALACDIRIASDNARLITAFSKVALSGDFGGSWFLTNLVGPAKAKELYFLSEKILSEEALSLGLFNIVVEDNELEEKTYNIARHLANGPLVALDYMKKNLNAAISQPLSVCLDLEALHHARTTQTEDHSEASRSFVEKRKPIFRGC